MQTPPQPQREPDRPADSTTLPKEHTTQKPGAPRDPATVLRPPTGEPVNPPLGSNGENVVDLFLSGDAHASDDAPTIISKGQPRPAQASPAAESLRGRKLAHFELLEPIGVGGMAAVLRAMDTQLDRTVALKVLPPEMATDPENVRRFHQEARSAAKLDHENIARVFYCGEDQKLHFIAFEFVEGENLRTLFDKRGPLPVPEAIHYMLQIATGLAHAAARGVVHRDIKPSNIIISPNGRAKLVDMGLARMAETKSEEGLTHSGVTLGTFDYISPEQALEPRDADVRSDIYSLGCTFYHVLTGNAPVPEGTAAKKLHHHQHEAPLDPRELNPNIPDDVAAILARMMAKDPADRYQRAEHLVQHLLQAARKLGIAPPAPEGAAFADPPLPNPPRTRPLLVAGLAAMTLLTAILFLGGDRGKRGTILFPFAGNSRTPQKEARSSTEESRPRDKADSPTPIKSEDQQRAAPEPKRIAVASAKEWLAELEKLGDSSAREVEWIITNNIDLPFTADGRPIVNLRLRGKKLVLRGSENAKEKPTIRFTYDVGIANELLAQTRLGEPHALIVESDEVTVKGLRFVIDAKGSTQRMASLILRGTPSGYDKGQYQIESCEFMQAGQPTNLIGDRPASILVDSANNQPQLVLNDCYFVGADKVLDDKLEIIRIGGQDAVTLRTPSKVEANNCAFGPHYALFRLESGAASSELKLRYCAALMQGEAAVFHLAGDRAAGALEVEHSVVSGLNPFLTEPLKGAVLIRQDRRDAQADSAIRYTGADNRYQGLEAFWIRPGDAKPKAETLDDFKLKAEDTSPGGRFANLWKEADPMAALERGEPAKAFQLDESRKELHSGDSPDRRRMVGLQSCAWGKHGLVPEENAVSNGRRILIVDPTLKQTHDRQYPNIQGALADSKGDEDVEIQLRFNGPEPMAPLVVDKRKITIRPYPKSHPVLTLGESRDKNSHLFRILDGELILEALELRLQPDKPLASQAVAEMIGDGKCTLRQCIVTLDPSKQQIPLAVVALNDADAVQMRMDQQMTGKIPQLMFENCLLRGQGDWIVSHTGKPFDMTANNVWVALTGSVLSCDAPRDENTPGPDQPIHMRLNQVTAAAMQYLVWLRATQDFKAATRVEASATNCIFQATNGKSLLHLEGPPDPGEDRIKELIAWKPNQNSYSGFDNLLDNQPPMDKMPASPITRREWPDWPGEVDSKFNFPPKPPAMELVRPELPLALVLPEHFKLRTSVPAGRGAVVEAIPRPASPSTASTPAKSTE
jgi:serine/threonine protein kinase